MVLLFSAFLAIGGFNGGFLNDASAEANTSGTKTVSPTPTGGTVVTGTPSAGTDVIVIPVTGTTNLVLASQILGFDVYVQGSPSVGATGTPSGAGEATRVPTRAGSSSGTATPTLSTSGTSAPTTGQATRTVVPRVTSTPSIGGTTSPTPAGGLVGSSGQADQQIGSVVDILVLNNVFLQSNPISGTAEPDETETTESNASTSTPAPTRAATATPNSAGTATQSATRTAASTTQPSRTGTLAVTPAATTAATESTPSAGSSSMSDTSSTGQADGQMVFVIAELDAGENSLGNDSSDNLVAIPWDMIQIFPAEERVVVTGSVATLQAFPFFSRSDWATLGSSGALQEWFTFWDLPVPSGLPAGTRSGNVNSTPLAPADITPTIVP